LVGFLALAWALAPACPPARAADWPGWRGPNHDDSSTEVPEKLPEAKKAEAEPSEPKAEGVPAGGRAERILPRLAPLWRRPSGGPAMAGIAAAEGRVVVPCFAQKKDIYRCYTADLGEAAWEWSMPDTQQEMDYSPTPRATPLIRQGKVYVLGTAGDLTCLDLKKGTVVWQVNFVKEFGAKVPKWGYSSSPILADGKLIVSPGSKEAWLAALDPATGKAVWKAPGNPPRRIAFSYSTLLVGEFGGVHQIVGWDAVSLGGWDPATGRRLWTIPGDGEPEYVVPSPVAWNGKMLVTDSRSLRLYDFEKTGVACATPVALNDEVTAEMCTPTLLGDLALLTAGGLQALDLSDSLKRVWTNDKEDGFTAAAVSHIIVGNGRAMVFPEDGTLSLVVPEKAGCRILGTVKVSGRTMSHPALADGKLYVRDERFVYCYAMKP
jgi:outer membrane protein assembly factor BamB